MENSVERVEVGFAQVSNNVLFDKNLSLKAKGLFAYLYAKPVTWSFSATRIASEIKEGRGSILAGMQELELNGYLIRKRQHNGRVKYLISYTKQEPQSENPTMGIEPQSKNPTVGKPHRRDPGLIINKEFNKQREEINTLATATPQKDVATEGKKVKEKVDPNEPKLLKDFLEECKASKSPHIHVIGEWADTIKPDFKTRGEWSVFLKRNLRPATDLAKFPKHQVERAYVQILKDSKNGEKFRPTLETIIKYLIK